MVLERGGFGRCFDALCIPALCFVAGAAVGVYTCRVAGTPALKISLHGRASHIENASTLAVKISSSYPDRIISFPAASTHAEEKKNHAKLSNAKSVHAEEKKNNAKLSNANHNSSQRKRCSYDSGAMHFKASISEVRRCMRNAKFAFAGFSEMRELSNALIEQIACDAQIKKIFKKDPCLVMQQVRSYDRADHHHLATCREDLYSKTPARINCRNSNSSLMYEWKSFNLSPRDEVFLDRVRALAQDGGDVFLLIGSGAHHFTKFKEHKKSMTYEVDDSFMWPQAWIDDYISQKLELFTMLSTSRPANVYLFCKTNNIGTRSGKSSKASGSLHHPSATNGVFHWLNRVAITHAKERGIPIFDVMPATLRETRNNKKEIDFYHDVDFNAMALQFLRLTCDARRKGCSYR